MDTLGSFSTTGRRLRGPASDLVELVSDRGLTHTAIVFHPEYRDHRALTDALAVVRGFLESPMVTGLVELVEHVPEEGAFVYPTGQCWSVAEVIRVMADAGEAAGVRAGLELMYATGQILVEAAEIGEAEGVYSHGGLSPWRVMVRKDGQVLVIGYALPQVDILAFQEDPQRVPSEDSFRYCPPERLEGAAEDIGGDLFALALVGFEVMTGKPVYDGLVDDIRRQAARAEGSRRLFRFRDQLPNEVRELLTTALRPDPADRFPSAADFLEAVRRCLALPGLPGAPLIDVMARVAGQVRRVGGEPEAARTMMASREELRKMLEAEDAAGEGERPAGRAWSAPPAERRRTPASRRTARRLRGEGAEVPAAQDAEAPPPPAREEEPAADAPEQAAPGAEPGAGVRGAAAPEEASPRRRWSRPERRRRPTAEDLIERIRTSVDGAAPRAEPRDEERKSTEEVIRRILSSSRDRSRRARRPRRLRGDGAEAPPVERQVAGDAPAEPAPEPGDADTAATDGPPAARPRPAAPPVGEASGERAASTIAPAARAPLGANEEEEGGATMVLPRGASPRPRPAPRRPAPAEPVAPADAPPPAKSRARAAAPAAPSAPAGSSTGAPAGPRAAPAPASLPVDLGRVPDPVPSAAAGGGSATCRIARGPGGRVARMRLPLAATVAEAVSWLVGNLVPVRADLAGRITGWYRLGTEEGPVPASRRVAELDRERLLVLHFVPSTTVLASVEVRLPEGPPVRFLSPVGTAVPASTLVDHLAALLGLPAADWRLRVDGRALDAHGILADLDLSERPELVLESRPSAPPPPKVQ